MLFISLGLKSLSLRRTLRLVAVASRHPSRHPVSPVELATAVDWALSLGYPLLRRNCLRRALALFYLLRRSGIPVELHLGVRNEAARPDNVRPWPWQLNGHAWLTLEDRAVFESDRFATTSYVETFRFDGDWGVPR